MTKLFRYFQNWMIIQIIPKEKTNTSEIPVSCGHQLANWSVLGNLVKRGIVVY